MENSFNSFENSRQDKVTIIDEPKETNLIEDFLEIANMIDKKMIERQPNLKREEELKNDVMTLEDPQQDIKKMLKFVDVPPLEVCNHVFLENEEIIVEFKSKIVLNQFGQDGLEKLTVYDFDSNAYENPSLLDDLKKVEQEEIAERKKEYCQDCSIF